MYAYVIARCDIGYAVTFLARYSQSPSKGHYLALKNVAKYLRATRDYGIYYWRDKPRNDLPLGPKPVTHSLRRLGQAALRCASGTMWSPSVSISSFSRLRTTSSADGRFCGASSAISSTNPQIGLKTDSFEVSTRVNHCHKIFPAA